MKKVVMTGGTGFIGTHLVKLLSSEKGTDLILIDNLSNSQFPNFMGIMKRVHDIECIHTTKARFYRADICDADALDWIFSKEGKIDTCIHLAAKVNVADSFKNQNETFDVNVRGTKNVLTASTNYGVKTFVFASSAAVYGSSKDLPLFEGGKLHPISPYGESKVRGENLVSSFSKEIPNALSLRFFNVYGLGQTLQYAGVISRFADRLLNGLPPLIHGNGCQTRDFVSVRDVARAVAIASRVVEPHPVSHNARKISEGRVYNVGTGIPTRIEDLARVMIEIFSYRRQDDKPNLKSIYTKAAPGDIDESCADVTRAIHGLGFRYSIDLKSGLNSIYK